MDLWESFSENRGQLSIRLSEKEAARRLLVERDYGKHVWSDVSWPLEELQRAAYISVIHACSLWFWGADVEEIVATLDLTNNKKFADCSGKKSDEGESLRGGVSSRWNDKVWDIRVG